MRVRAFVQDDAHIFCTEDQVNQETAIFCELLMSIYRDFGFTDVTVKFADRPKVRAGDDKTWDQAERSLKEALDQTGLDYVANPGEGAFYGPKLEFVLRDAIGRDWQCGTLQVDFVLPERLGATFVGEDGAKHQPVMLHRAILGSFERFIGILIEHYAGRFPMWMAPVQAVVATITNESDNHARKVHKALQETGLRTEIDLRNETINYKVREHTLAKIPAILVIGAREAEQDTVSLRWLGGKSQEVLALDQAVAKLSSAATLPVTMERVEEHIGVDKEISSFVLPVGATINMDGTSLYQGVAAVFISQALGFELTFSGQLTIVLTALLASIGSAAVPCAGMVMLVIVLEAIGFPADKLAIGLALIFAVDRPLDMLRTVVNITGDATVSMMVAKSVGQTIKPKVKNWDDNLDEVR